MGNDHTLPTALLDESEREQYERERHRLPSLHVASFLGEEAKIRSDRRLQSRDVNKRSKMGRYPSISCLSVTRISDVDIVVTCLPVRILFVRGLNEAIQ
jgi:hypothetical protein